MATHPSREAVVVEDAMHGSTSTSTMQPGGGSAAATTPFVAEDDVIGHVPTYAMPSISSMLPSYRNSEQVCNPCDLL